MYLTINYGVICQEMSHIKISLKELWSNISKNECGVILLSANAGTFKSTLMLQLIFEKTSENENLMTIYVFAKNLPLEKFSDLLEEDLLHRIKILKVKSFEELAYLINLLPRYLILNKLNLRKKIKIIALDDIPYLFYASPISPHKVAGSILLIEMLSILYKLSRDYGLYVFLTDYLTREGKPLMWKVVSKYIDLVLCINREYDVVKVEIFNNNLNKLNEIELHEYNGLLSEVKEAG